MNTDEVQAQPAEMTPAPEASQAPSDAPSAPAEASNAITGLVGELQAVDTSSPQAAQNETTISDNNGGRIELGENSTDGNIITK
jgi:hypothetical protein